MAAIALLVLPLLPVGAQTVGDPARGKERAVALCAACHSVDPGFAAPGRDGPQGIPAPSFVAIAEAQRYTADYIMDWVTAQHPFMPRFELPQSDLEDIVSHIFSMRKRSLPSGRLAPWAVGTGFFVSAEGHLVAAARAVSNCERITVRTSQGKDLRAVDKTLDDGTGLAILRAETGGQPFAGFARGQLTVGALVPVFAYPAVTGEDAVGRISAGRIGEAALFGTFAGMFRLEIGLPPGMNDGPIFGSAGLVEGMAVSWMIRLRSGTSSALRRLHYAVPAERIAAFLRANGVVPQPKGQGPAPSRPSTAKEYSARVTCWN